MNPSRLAGIHSYANSLISDTVGKPAGYSQFFNFLSNTHLYAFGKRHIQVNMK